MSINKLIKHRDAVKDKHLKKFNEEFRKKYEEARSRKK